MRCDWDPAKDVLNQLKHGLTLADGIPALEDPQRESWIDDRFDYGEERVITLGLTQAGVLYVVTIELDEDLTRIISVRRAESHEVQRYDQSRT
ncbi:MAG: BrnT family toxin [Terracidiphilus sp.]